MDALLDLADRPVSDVESDPDELADDWLSGDLSAPIALRVCLAAGMCVCGAGCPVPLGGIIQEMIFRENATAGPQGRRGLLRL